MSGHHCVVANIDGVYLQDGLSWTVGRIGRPGVQKVGDFTYNQIREPGPIIKDLKRLGRLGISEVGLIAGWIFLSGHDFRTFLNDMKVFWHFGDFLSCTCGGFLCGLRSLGEPVWSVQRGAED